MKRIVIISCLAILAVSCGRKSQDASGNIPITPAWALGHIVWEDEFNTQESANALVEGYLSRDIPVGGIIIDSPWETSYNNFEWDHARYPEPAEMISGFRGKGVRTILWMTGCMNGSQSDEDCPVVKSSNYDEAVAKGFVINGGEESEWWKGKGVHLDFTNPKAVEWWYSQIDKIMLPGVEGFKVDQGEISFGDSVSTSIGRMTNHQFRLFYYDAMFDYVNSRRPGTGMILARPWSFQGDGCFSSPAKLSTGWCGDFVGDWSGLKFQLENIYKSARHGYGACGTEVGGFMGATPSKAQLIRYAQFGAMTAAMVNGGMNGPFDGHLAWNHGEDAQEIYRDVVKLHYRLLPYIFSTIVETHLSGGTLLRNVNFEEESHMLGADIFTKAITSDDGKVSFTLPAGGEWVDWRSGECFDGGSVISREYPLDEFPLFVRKGSIIPLKDGDGFTMMVIPGESPMKAVFHLPEGDGTDYFDCTVTYNPANGKTSVKGAGDRDISFSQFRPVNPFVGTGGIGHTYPGATAPFGMVQLSADTHNTGWDGAAGYRDCDSTILGFSHTHLSGTGGVDLGDFLISPSQEPVPFLKEDEVAFPGYYSVDTKDFKAELTALPRVGCHRHTFHGDAPRQLVLDLRYNIGGTRPSNISFNAVSDVLVEGGRHVRGWAQSRWIFFSAALSVPFTECRALGEDRYLLTFPADIPSVTVCVGLSSTSAELARRNRLAEAPECSFDLIKSASLKLWDGELGKIETEGGTPEQRTNFYTALYHCAVAPNVISDIDAAPFYSTLSLWDTFRTWNPLQTILNPQLVTDMASSMLAMYERDGKLPLWALGGVDVDCMIGYHSVSVIADAWLRGIRGFDGEKALEAMVKSSNLDPASAWYNAYGYIPSDFTPESVSKTLEFCYDDWCIARMAESMGKADIASEYYARALRYRNLFDPSTGFFRGKDSEGNWRAPFNSFASSRDYTEATAWQYRHFVTHDAGGFTGLMGGRDAALYSLDSLFLYNYVHPEMEGDGNVTGLKGQYAHGNEPSHASAWLYTCLGDPSSTQKLVREILEEMYEPTPDGLCGNEDCGQMSAWYVMAAMGIYPLCPGSGEFVLCSPLFSKVRISLPGGKRFTITSDNPSNPYVKDVVLNGKRLDGQFVTYDEIMAGGTLEFKTSSKPFHGRDALQTPYSMSGPDVVSTPYLTGNPRFFDGSFTSELLCRTEGADIRYTLDGTEPGPGSALYEGPFEITEECVLKAKAFREGWESSPLLSCRVFPVEYLDAVEVAGLQEGCRYTYHRGNFMRVADVEASPAVSSGIMPYPSIDGAVDDDHFGYIFSGYVDVPEEGLWEFAVTSDDGAVLELDGLLVVNGDGSHANYMATGHVALRKGIHSFRLRYLEDYEGQNLDLAWKLPGSAEFIPVPASKILYK